MDSPAQPRAPPGARDRPLDTSPHRANEHPLTALSLLLASKRAPPRVGGGIQRGAAVRPSSARGAASTSTPTSEP